MQFKKITIITGEYGSGKTNLAVNLAYAMKEHGTTAIVDIDTVNPYFRTADFRDELTENGIDVIRIFDALNDILFLLSAFAGAVQMPELSLLADISMSSKSTPATTICFTFTTCTVQQRFQQKKLLPCCMRLKWPAA